jgi:Mannosyltransferase (PIG-V)
VPLRLGTHERRAAAFVLCSHAVVVGFLLLSAMTSFRGDVPSVPFVHRLEHWDAFHYLHIAHHGYGNAMAGEHPLAAFFPGFPAVVRVVHTFGPGYIWSSVLIDVVATVVAAIAFTRIAALDGYAEDGPLGVLFLVLAPATVFLSVPYTEALFLGLALPAWLMARRRRWWAAGVLGGMSCFVRVDGIFLLVALVVLFVTTDRPRRIRDCRWLSVPIGAVLALEAFYWRLTADPLGWVHAEQIGWHRALSWPWETARTTIPLVHPSHGYTWTQLASSIDVLALAAAVASVVVLWRRRRWAEAVWVGLPFLVLSTSNRLWSLDRAALLAWPMFLLLASVARSRPWVTWTYVTVSSCLAMVVLSGYSTGAWVG